MVLASFHLNNKEAKCELNIKINGSCQTHQEIPTYVGVKLDRTLTYIFGKLAHERALLVLGEVLRGKPSVSWPFPCLCSS